mmetsp:Transcript_969/g.2595  ORF Transcript_969/g.2595 Transcript_969/m.2595 type:complete len:94 (+) Transcript_969:500-781(+)
MPSTGLHDRQAASPRWQLPWTLANACCRRPMALVANTSHLHMPTTIDTHKSGSANARRPSSHMQPAARPPQLDPPGMPDAANIAWSPAVRASC